MTTTTRRQPPRRPPPGRGSGPGRPPRRLPVLLIVLGFAVAALIVAIVVSRSDNKNKTANTPPGGLHQTQPMSVEGAPLLKFPGSARTDPAVGKPMPTLKGKSFDGRPV